MKFIRDVKPNSNISTSYLTFDPHLRQPIDASHNGGWFIPEAGHNKVDYSISFSRVTQLKGVTNLIVVRNAG
jgi:hypothetical protein